MMFRAHVDGQIEIVFDVMNCPCTARPTRLHDLLDAVAALRVVLDPRSPMDRHEGAARRDRHRSSGDHVTKVRVAEVVQDLREHDEVELPRRPLLGHRATLEADVVASYES